jgi:hypothetical protein
MRLISVPDICPSLAHKTDGWAVLFYLLSKVLSLGSA